MFTFIAVASLDLAALNRKRDWKSGKFSCLFFQQSEVFVSVIQSSLPSADCVICFPFLTDRDRDSHIERTCQISKRLILKTTFEC